MKTLAILVPILLALLAAPLRAAPAVWLERAEHAFAEGEALAGSDPAAARARFDESIAAFRQILDLGIENAAIHRNIGNAHMLRGDLGRAVASFRRGERIDPHDPRIRESLAAARAQVRTEVHADLGARMHDALLFWRGRIPRSALFWTGLACWAVAWAAGAVRLLARRGLLTAIAAGLVCSLTLGSLIAERTLLAFQAEGVIVQDGVTARRGPSEGVYTPAFEQPLRAGVEASILERRGEWLRLRFRNGVEAWVRAEAVERI
jgi:tetratricopeptide (TPR) repeat protein